jgi:hypothetical protein
MSKIRVNGMLDKSSDCLIYYWAPRAIEDKYADNCVPYSSPEQAYDNSSNVGVTTCNKSGMFELMLDNPAPYYINGEYIKPHVNVKSQNNPNKVITIMLDNNEYIINEV